MNIANINVVSKGFEVQAENGEVLGFSECILDANALMHEIHDAMRVVRIPDRAVCTKKLWLGTDHFWAKLWKYQESA